MGVSTISDKIVPINEIKRLSEYLKKEGNTIVTTNGIFDIIHAGHIQYLRDAKRLGDILIVGVNSDISASKIKGNNRPIVPLEQRLIILEALEPVDFIVVYDELFPTMFINEVRPHYHVKGGDYINADIHEAEILKSIGAELVITDYYYDTSVSNIINQILDRYSYVDINKIFKNIVKKNWGYEFWVHNNDICYKILVLKKGWLGSLHYHSVKNEQFTVIDGAMLLELGAINEYGQYIKAETIEMRVGDTRYISRRTCHRFSSLTDTTVVLEESSHHDDADTYRITNSCMEGVNDV